MSCKISIWIALRSLSPVMSLLLSILIPNLRTILHLVYCSVHWLGTSHERLLLRIRLCSAGRVMRPKMLSVVWFGWFGYIPIQFAQPTLRRLPYFQLFHFRNRLLGLPSFLVSLITASGCSIFLQFSYLFSPRIEVHVLQLFLHLLQCSILLSTPALLGQKSL